MTQKERMVAVLRMLSYLLVFFWGMAIVKWQVPPYGVYVQAKQVLGFPRYLGPDAELAVRYAFVGPLVDAEKQLDPPVRKMGDVSDRVRKLELGVDDFRHAWDRAGELKGSFPRPGLFALEFELGRMYTAYCYLAKADGSDNSTAILFIPGSGYNQSGEIISHNVLESGAHNYHKGFLEAARKHGDVYVYIKPNEDIRAIHDGRHKLSYDFITNTLIGHGGSYSAYYIAETIAIVKHLKGKYRRVIVAGVSQGASAALLNGIQSWPDAVISISAGTLPSNTYAYHASPFNIMIPGIDRFYPVDNIVTAIKSHKTRWLFTLGKGDTGSARIAYEEDQLLKTFSGVATVSIIKHGGGHEVPAAKIDAYLNP